MGVFTETFLVPTSGNCEVLNITDQVSGAVRNSGMASGVVTVFVPGSTASVSTVEYEPGLVEDLQELFERIAPEGKEYHHNIRWQDGNGHSHVRATLLGPSTSVPFVDSRMLLGIWQQLILIDFDNKTRDRKVVCQVIGE